MITSKIQRGRNTDDDDDDGVSERQRRRTWRECDDKANTICTYIVKYQVICKYFGSAISSLQSRSPHLRSMVQGGDFGELQDGAEHKMVPKNGIKDASTHKRKWLKVFETMPAQMLNAYGPAKYAKLSDEEVWQHLNAPLKSGAEYMTELCDGTAERRGVGLNRWLHAVKVYCEWQNDPEVKKQNQVLLKEDKFKEVYEEIASILPLLEFCLAPRKVSAKAGASCLRASGMDQPTVERKDESALDAKAAKLYEWLDVSKVSRIRMLMHWQASAGLSYVASVHHRGTQTFKYEGNRLHGEQAAGITLVEFQDAIKSRHRVGSTGMESQGVREDDFRA